MQGKKSQNPFAIMQDESGLTGAECGRKVGLKRGSWHNLTVKGGRAYVRLDKLKEILKTFGWSPDKFFDEL